MFAGKQFELTLFRLVAGGHKALVGSLARGGLLSAYDLAALVADKILASQATLGVVGRAVKYLGLAADGAGTASLWRNIVALSRIWL